MLKQNDALLVVDIQRDFLPGGALGVPNGDEVVPLLAACIEEFRNRKLPVVASRDWHPPDHCSFQARGGPWPPHCVADTPGAEFDAGLGLAADAKVVSKASDVDREAYSAFEGTDLDAWLHEQGIDRLFIGGLATEYCVLNTANDALRLGYDVVVLEDTIRAIDQDAGENALLTLREGGAEMGQSGELLDG